MKINKYILHSFPGSKSPEIIFAKSFFIWCNSLTFMHVTHFQGFHTSLIFVWSYYGYHKWQLQAV